MRHHAVARESRARTSSTVQAPSVRRRARFITLYTLLILMAAFLLILFSYTGFSPESETRTPSGSFSLMHSAAIAEPDSFAVPL